MRSPNISSIKGNQNYDTEDIEKEEIPYGQPYRRPLGATKSDMEPKTRYLKIPEKVRTEMMRHIQSTKFSCVMMTNLINDLMDSAKLDN